MYCFSIESGSAAARKDAVGPGPQHRLAIDAVELMRKLLSQQPGAGGLEVVHEHGKIEIRRQFEQQVDVVGLTVQFEQFAAPTSAASALPSTLRAYNSYGM